MVEIIQRAINICEGDNIFKIEVNDEVQLATLYFFVSEIFELKKKNFANS